MPRARCAVFVALLLVLISSTPNEARRQAETIEELIAWLDVPQTEWIATARLQEVPDAAARALEGIS